MLVLLAINMVLLKKREEQNYTLQILILCLYLAIGTSEKVVILTIILTLLLVAIKEMIINKKDNKKQITEEKQNKNIPIGFYLCFTNIVVLILKNMI